MHPSLRDPSSVFPLSRCRLSNLGTSEWGGGGGPWYHRDHCIRRRREGGGREGGREGGGGRRVAFACGRGVLCSRLRPLGTHSVLCCLARPPRALAPSTRPSSREITCMFALGIILPARHVGCALSMHLSIFHGLRSGAGRGPAVSDSRPLPLCLPLPGFSSRQDDPTD